jgi:16S rRNA (guanine(1405)-N(7))-methyltransferase
VSREGAASRVAQDAASRVTQQVLASRRYRHVDEALVTRLAADELQRRGTETEAVKQVKRRLHQAVGAYRSGPDGGRNGDQLTAVRAAWTGDLRGAAFMDRCRTVLARHASTRERLPDLENFYTGIWKAVGRAPGSILDLGCGLGPVALPWMGLPSSTTIQAVEVDTTALATVDDFLSLVGQPHDIEPLDLVTAIPSQAADIALLLKLVPLLDRQDPTAAARLIAGIPASHAVVSFPRRSLGGRGKGMETTYRLRMEALVGQLGERVVEVLEASVPTELVFVLTLRPATDG